ncbi:MAG: hypothetical protein WD077_12355 [Bacteroidia bacterium]
MQDWTKDELQLMNDHEIMLAKRRIIKKVRLLFAAFRERLHPELEGSPLLRQIAADGGKISHGENYKGLPFVILDFPAALSGEDVFTFRTMFWWGRYYSFNLLARGKYLEHVAEWIQSRQEALAQEGFYIATGNDLWENEIAGEHYQQLTQDFEIKKLIARQNFIRLNKPVSLNTSQNLFLPDALQIFHALFL